jgi:hypothetical protein
LSKFDARVGETVQVFVSIGYIQFVPISSELGSDFFCHLECLRAGFGDAQIKFFESPFEEVADLGPIETEGAFFFSMGMTITAGKDHSQIRLRGLLLPPFPNQQRCSFSVLD